MDKVFSLTEGNESFFFRGQADSDWYLLPSLIRSNPYLFHSKDIYEKVEKYNKDNINLKSEDFLSKMVFFQHYGIPTCLLDWTTNALIALFFAVSAEYKKDGMVFLAKPDRIIKNDSGEWQIQSQLFENLYYKSDDNSGYKEVARKIYEIYTRKGKQKLTSFFIEPKFDNERIRVQEGYFSATICFPQNLLKNSYIQQDINNVFLEDFLIEKDQNPLIKKFDQLLDKEQKGRDNQITKSGKNRFEIADFAVSGDVEVRKLWENKKKTIDNIEELFISEGTSDISFDEQKDNTFLQKITIDSKSKTTIKKTTRRTIGN